MSNITVVAGVSDNRFVVTAELDGATITLNAPFSSPPDAVLALVNEFPNATAKIVDLVVRKIRKDESQVNGDGS